MQKKQIIHKSAIGQKLRKLRQKLKLSRPAFSEKTGIPVRTLAHYEAGAEPKGIFLERIKEAIAWAEAELAAQEQDAGAPPHVAEPETEDQLSPGLSADAISRITLAKDDNITDEAVPKEWRASDVFLMEIAAWMRRMLIMDLKCQPQIVKRFKRVMAEFEAELEEEVEGNSPPGLPAGEGRQEEGGAG